MLSSYGSVTKGCSTGKSLDMSSKTRPKAASTPIFLENPDGTIAEAVPSNFKRQGLSNKASLSLEEDAGDVGAGQGSPHRSANTSEPPSPGAIMYGEAEFLYLQHVKVLIGLLCLHVIFEVLYSVVYVLHMQDSTSVWELADMYGYDLQQATGAKKLLWAIFVLQFVYSIIYYTVSSLAVCTRRASWYRHQANFGVLGIVGSVLLAYIDKFNLILFFLQLLAYIYARYLQGLTGTMMLLPQPGGQAAETSVALP